MPTNATSARFQGAVDIDPRTVLVTFAVDTQFQFEAGQYIEVMLPGGGSRSYSIANVDDGRGQLEFHVRRWPGGAFSDGLLHKLRFDDLVSLRGPFGAMRWREGAGPAIMLATGTGVAPLRAMLLERARRGSTRPVQVFDGGRLETDLYFKKLPQSPFGPNVRYEPVLSRPPDLWRGRRGYVQEAAGASMNDLLDADIFACGSPAMVAAAQAAMAVLPGYSPDRFHADAFQASRGLEESGDMLESAAPQLSISVVLPDGSRIVPARAGMSVLAALRSAGIKLQSICGGQASCAMCRFSPEGYGAPLASEPDRVERRLLRNLDDFKPGERLACQVILSAGHDGLAIRPTFPIIDATTSAGKAAQ